MNEKQELVIVVSRLAGSEGSFFPSWGVTDPVVLPYGVYLSQAGAACDACEAQMLLLRGDQEEPLKSIVCAALETDANLSSAYLLVHPGGGRDLTEALGGMSVPAKFTSAWATLGCRSFTWSTALPGLHDFLEELAIYAKTKKTEAFQNGLTLLRNVLSQVLELHSGSFHDAETRAGVAWKSLQDSTLRLSASLSEVKPPRAPRNPVANLIHDVVSHFDALLIDLQTALEDSDYWQTEKNRYQGSAKRDADRLSQILTENDVLNPNLPSVSQIGDQIEKMDSTTDADRRLLHSTLLQLEALTIRDDTSAIFNLFSRINDGSMDEIKRAEIQVLQGWLNDLRGEFAVLDELYRRCVLGLVEYQSKF